MPTTKTLTSIELIPGKNHINCKYTTVITDTDGTVLSSKHDGKSYIGGDKFSIEIAPTGASLADIVAAFNAAASEERIDVLAALKTAQDALAAAEAQVASLQAQIDAYTPPVVAPTVPVVSMRQARLALNAAGLLDAVEAAVAEAGDGVKIEWEYAAEVRRDWPTLVDLAGALGLTDAQLDALFAQAALL